MPGAALSLPPCHEVTPPRARRGEGGRARTGHTRGRTAEGCDLRLAGSRMDGRCSGPRAPSRGFGLINSMARLWSSQAAIPHAQKPPPLPCQKVIQKRKREKRLTHACVTIKTSFFFGIRGYGTNGLRSAVDLETADYTCSPHYFISSPSYHIRYHTVPIRPSVPTCFIKAELPPPTHPLSLTVTVRSQDDTVQYICHGTSVGDGKKHSTEHRTRRPRYLFTPLFTPLPEAELTLRSAVSLPNIPILHNTQTYPDPPSERPLTRPITECEPIDEQWVQCCHQWLTQSGSTLRIVVQAHAIKYCVL
jgi:hypothetical protein